MSYNISNNFFSSMLGTTSTGNSNTGFYSLLGDYSSIRNGSYLKLAKHYYTSDAAKETTKKQFSTKFSTTSEDKVTKAAAESTWKDISALRSEKLYEKKSVTKEDGTTTEEYDRETIQNKVKGFVDSYNSVIEGAQDSDNTNVLKEASRLVTQTKNYTSALSKIGITVQKDNTLLFDETAFSDADMSDVKDLFAGDFSFGSNTQSRMLQIASDASGNAMTGLYSASGSVVGTTVGSFYNSLF